MGQSQLLIIAVSVLIIGFAILAGVGYFRSDDVQANKHAMINDVNQIAHLSVRFYARPKSLQGGDHSFVGFVLPDHFRSTLNGKYSTIVVSSNLLMVMAISARDSSNTMTAEVGPDGKAGAWTFTGDFR